MDHFTIAYVLKTYFNSPCLGMYKYIFAVVVRPCCNMFENNCRSLRNMVNCSSFLNSKASCSPCMQRKHVLPAIRTFVYKYSNVVLKKTIIGFDVWSLFRNVALLSVFMVFFQSLFSFLLSDIAQEKSA